MLAILKGDACCPNEFIRFSLSFGVFQEIHFYPARKVPGVGLLFDDSIMMKTVMGMSN